MSEIFIKRDVDLDQMKLIGDSLADIARAGDVFVLKGDLGAGKTTLVKHVAKALGSTNEVTSPTFAIVAKYAVQNSSIVSIIHVDTYRLNHANELYDLGLETIFDVDAITLIEWGDRISQYLQTGYFEVNLDDSQTDSRIISLAWVGELSLQRQNEIEESLVAKGWDKS